MKIFIAAAHGANDPGAVANGTTEREEAIKVVNGAAALIALLGSPSYQMVIVPHDLGLKEAVAYINKHTTDIAKDICIEVNMNSNVGTPQTGTETFYGLPKLAQTLQKNLVATLGLKDRGAKNGNNLYFNNSTKPGSALVELGFINNMADLMVVRNLGALALAKGVAEYIGLQLPPTAPVPPSAIDWKQQYKNLRAAVQKVLNDNI